jgi:lysophospholipase L1-like esterase
MFRCNGSVYTREVLQAANLAGLEAGVEPSVFLNHRSFHDEGSALQFVQKLTRGAIISIKLGQELDYSEYDGAAANMEDIAIDPPPFLSDDMESTISTTYANIVPVVTWLMEALKAEGYAVVSPEELQAYRISMFDFPNQLDEKTLSALNPDNYSFPATDLPMGVQEHTPVNSSSLYGKILVGDALTTGMQHYVNWRRQSLPEYLDGVQFLTSANLSIVSSLMQITATSDHPQLDNVRLSVEDALASLNAKTVLIMPGINDVRRYSQKKLIDSLMILIYQIRLKIPNIQICLQTVPPGVKGRFGEPSNARIFQYNMAIAKFCLEYDIPLIDTAYALRDSEGNLIDNLCLDPDTAGIHLNDAGYEQWINFLERFMPF